ncbi:hypothetical protein [Sphingomonas sp. Leaf231]|uniref:hypothetical protein n=1 Tax=Sphingomonas sp. Leaf231 TaxID=1736301 RepID=UPI0012E228FF|nr:hypothetical protein [Sphingomonas sp. Leaf231]
MRFRAIMMLVSGATAAVTGAQANPPSPPQGGGTVAVISPTDADHDEGWSRISREAALMVLGDKGFTLLDDRDHAAYVAEVITTRSQVGTSVAKARGETPVVAGASVSIPIARRKSVLVPMQRTMIEIRLRKRGGATAFWQGSAVTVRAGKTSGALAERLAFELSQAALSSYPGTTAGTISIP